MKESFSWVSPDMVVNDAPGDKVIIRGPALFSYEKFFGQGISRNRRKYIQDEILQSARTLTGAEMDVNHEISAWEEAGKHGPRPKGKGHVVYGQHEEGKVEYVAEINSKEYAQKARDTDKVRKGKMTEQDYYEKWGKKPLVGVSVDADFIHMECPNCKDRFYNPKEFEHHMINVELQKNFTWEPRGIIFKRLSLVEPPESPGVIGAGFEIVETAQQGMARLFETVIKVSGEIEKMTNKIPYKIKENEQEIGETVNTTPSTTLPTPSKEEALHPSPIDIKQSEVQLTQAQTPSENPKPKLPEATNVTQQSTWEIEKPKILADLANKTKEIEMLKKALRLGEPFADYKDWDDCIAKNSDKDDPAAYCGDIKHKTEDKTKESLEQKQQRELHELQAKQEKEALNNKLAEIKAEINTIQNSLKTERIDRSTIRHELETQIATITEKLNNLPNDDLGWKEIKDDTSWKEAIAQINETLIHQPQDDVSWQQKIIDINTALAKLKESILPDDVTWKTEMPTLIKEVTALKETVTTIEKRANDEFAAYKKDLTEYWKPKVENLEKENKELKASITQNKDKTVQETQSLEAKIEDVKTLAENVDARLKGNFKSVTPNTVKTEKPVTLAEEKLPYS